VIDRNRGIDPARAADQSDQGRDDQPQDPRDRERDPVGPG